MAQALAGMSMTFAESMTAHAGDYLRACLKATDGNVREAAHIAGVHRATFYSLCARCKVQIRPAPKRPTKHAFSEWLVSKSENV